MMNYFLLADFQDITRAGLKLLLSQSEPDAVAVEIRSETHLVEQLVEHPNSVVVLDYALFDNKDVASILNLVERFPLSHWVIFSNELTQTALRRFAAENCISIVLKENSEVEIRSALQCSVRGGRYVCHQVSNMLAEERSATPLRVNLTATETEILKLIARGKSVKEIAAERCSSAHTIITHKKNIFRKIEVNTVYEATKYALHAGLVDLMEYYI